MHLEKNRMEEILCTLDEEGYIFPGFELVKQNNQLCLLGRGGFSTVYEIKCLERLQSQYVLKVIGFEQQVVTSENFWNTVQLQHYLCEQTQYVCRILSARELRVVLDEDGELCEVTEVTGERWNEDGLHLQFVLMEKLEDIITKDRFGNISLMKMELKEEGAVIDFALQVGQALHYAHKNNVLHRDVKLENIFWDGLSKCYKLGDFGIAKFVAGGSAETVVYTDGYGAPEIERRLNDYYNATADIYSFGITLYLLLNDLKFPGSEGYFVNMVQYNPEFVFPAPVHASEKMAKIIRKMCQFYQEERYQSIAEVLMDLSALKNGDVEQNEDNSVELPDLETETYREENCVNSAVSQIRRTELIGRAKRKEDEKYLNQIYTKKSVVYFLGFTILLTLLLRGLQAEVSIIYNWQFWIFPALVLIEAILLRVKEFYILFGGITLMVGVYSCISIGLTVPYILLLTGLLISVPIVTGACAVSTVLWAVLNISGKIQWLDFIGRYDLSWILLIIIFFILNRYVLFRIDFDKTTYMRAKISMFVWDKIYWAMAAVGLILLLLEKLEVMKIPEIIQRFHLVRTGLISYVLMAIYMIWCGYVDSDLDDEEVQVYEDEMDERGDGKRSDTIK